MYRIYAEGMIEVITGPMFSGKTEEIIRRVKILGYAKIKTLVVKPSFDTRWGTDSVITRAGASLKAVSIENPSEIIELTKAGNYEAVAIDEAQFFNPEIVNVIRELAHMKKRVLVAGLDQDAYGAPFGPMGAILAIADIVEKQHAVCFVCGRAATMTYKKINTNKLNEVGDKELYEARCRECHEMGEEQKRHSEKQLEN